MKEYVTMLCNYYNFNISNVDENECSSALGLGDIIRFLSCLKHNVINQPLRINLALFWMHYSKPINYIHFRLKMIKNIIDSNNIDSSKIIFYFNESTNESNKQTEFYKCVSFNSIKHLKLNFNTEIIQKQNFPENNEKYIIFHTKARFHEKIECVLQDLKIFENFISTFKTNYKIYILGEKQINRNNNEIIISPDIITHIYDILINLSHNNNVIDNSVDILVDNLDYDNFIKDIRLIQNAKYNIHFGDGGSMNLSLVFGKNTTIVYNRDMEEWNKASLEKENSFIFNNINDFLNKLDQSLSNNILGSIKPELRPAQKKEERDFVLQKLYKVNFKSNKNAYFLCHGGLGDLFFMNGAIRYLSIFYNKIYFFCPNSALKNLQIALSDIAIEFITYEKWYENYNTNNAFPKVSDSWYKTAAPHLCNIYNSLESSFHWKKYINTYEDLRHINNKADAYHHWVNYGKQEHRTFFIKDDCFFNWRKYVNHYSDLQHINNKENAYHHWLEYGKKECRQNFEMQIDLNADIFVAGEVFNKYIHYHIPSDIFSTYGVDSFTTKITNQDFINYNSTVCNSFVIPYYYYIKKFYDELGMNLSIYYDYFYIPSTSQSWELYKKIKDYKIVFLHFVSSCGEAYIPDNEWPHIYNEEYLIINPDKNHYNSTDSPVKYMLANQYLQLLSVDYIDILLHASDIYVCDSSFASIVFPLRIKDHLKADNFIIYDRYYPGNPANIPNPVSLPRNK